MNRDPHVDELLAPLRDEGPELSDRPVEIDRDRVLARMRDAAASVPLERARRTRRLAMLTFAAGFAVILGALAARRATQSAGLEVAAVSGDVTLQGSSARSIAAGESAGLAPEGELTTASRGEARIHVAGGLELDVFESTRLALADLAPASSSLRLRAGGVRCHVPRLAPKQTFSVVTPDATITVHGTVFSVEVRPDGSATTTTVRVDEGVVVVHWATGEIELTASQSWTNRPAAVSPAAGTPAPEPAADKPAKALPRGTPRRPPENAASSPGTLDQETRLLRSGLAAERNGDLAGAASSFEQLLSRYPQSPLVPDARAALDRVKARHGEPPR
jgi:FecR protein